MSVLLIKSDFNVFMAKREKIEFVREYYSVRSKTLPLGKNLKNIPIVYLSLYCAATGVIHSIMLYLGSFFLGWYKNYSDYWVWVCIL